MNIKSLAVRTISGAVYVALIVGCILWGYTGVAVIASVLGLLAVIEFDRITSASRRSSLPSLVLDICGVIVLTLSGFQLTYAIPLWIFVMLLRMTQEIYLGSDHPIYNVARSLMVQIYIGIPMCLMLVIPSFMGSSMPILALLLLIWINDTGAFLVGSTCGRHKLFERISPKKSWEGFFGGLVLTTLASVLFHVYCSDFFHLYGGAWIGLGLGLTVVVFATWGDLFESMIKRSLNIKDSGNIIPGHGGILDRIDSLLFVIPAALLFFLIVGR